MMGVREAGQPGLKSGPLETSVLVLTKFVPALPMLIVRHAAELGLPPAMSLEAVQVRRRVTDEDDIDPPGILVKAEVGGVCPALPHQNHIRTRFYDMVVEWFWEQGYEPREDIVVVMQWVQSVGLGSVRGVRVKW